MPATRGAHSEHGRQRYTTVAVVACLALVAAAVAVPASLPNETSDVLRGASLIALAIILAAVFTRLIDLWRELLQTRADTLGVVREAKKDVAATREILARLRR